MPSNPFEPAGDDRGGLDQYWPIWDVREGGFGALAKTVSPRSLNGHGLNASRTELDDQEDDLEMIDLLLRRLSERGFEYDEAKWTAAGQGSQPVRHPGWIASEGGNCLDLSSTFGAMCLAVGIAPLLAIAGDHVFVLLRPGWLRGHDRSSDPFTVDGGDVWGHDPGVLRISDASSLAQMVDGGSLIAVDCVTVVEEASPERAGEPCSAWIEEGLFLVDVVFEQDHGGHPPLDPPLSWPSVRRFPPEAIALPELNAAQSELLAQLSGLASKGGITAAIRAEPGSGKSTVARCLVAAQKNNAAWFLNASDARSLIDSLAEAEMAERGISDQGNHGIEAGSLENPDREAFALAALDRLRRAETPWLVVLDNANGDPALLHKYIPHPRSRQVVLFTTTGADPNWADGRWRPEVLRHELSPATEEEVAARFGGETLGEDWFDLIGGRPLMVETFERLLSDNRITVESILEAAKSTPAVESVDPAAGAYWSSLAGLRGESRLRLARIASCLPVDRLPVTLLTGLGDATGEDVDELIKLGFFNLDRSGNHVSVHRLIAKAVRGLELSDPGSLGSFSPATVITASQEACDLLALYGDPEVITELCGELERLLDKDPVSFDTHIRGLAKLAAVFELRGQLDRSKGVFATVEERIEGDDRYTDLKAECLFNRARAVNRDDHATTEMLEQANEDALLAYEMVTGGSPDGENAVESGRFLAMLGLLQKRLAPKAADRLTALAGLKESLATLERADELRANLGEMHPERVRSMFNLAGVRIALAKLEPEKAATHLTEADEIYAEVLGRRRRIFRVEVHSHTAICVQGRGSVAYFRAILVAESDLERSGYLRDSSRFFSQALAQWETIESRQDGAETAKANRLIAKTALARAAHRKLRREESPEGTSPGMVDFFGLVAKQATDDFSGRFVIDAG